MWFWQVAVRRPTTEGGNILPHIQRLNCKGHAVFVTANRVLASRNTQRGYATDRASVSAQPAEYVAMVWTTYCG